MAGPFEGQIRSYLWKKRRNPRYWGFPEALWARHMVPSLTAICCQKKDLLSMTDAFRLGFGPFIAPAKGILVVFCDDGLKFGPTTRKTLGSAADLVARAAKAERFTGKKNSALELVVPAGLKAARLVVIGLGKTIDLKPKDFLKLGGLAMGKLSNSASDATLFAEMPGGAMKSEQAADLAQGARLRAYAFDRYKTKRKDDEKPPATRNVTVAVGDVANARKAYEPRSAISDGVLLARDLVNEPANVLYPEEFARRAGALKKLRVAVEVLDPKAMKKLGMNALLGVGQGSVRESRVVVMRWNGGKAGEAPVAFIGKGVCFDTGGISIKPAASMEEMKGDMAGAACVVGLMHALAARKARVNAVGIIGLVENMPDGNAQRPGDIVKSMSGQTIEIINTDAEGRLVLADVIWYAAQRFKPKFMVDLATLTGAIVVALGQEYAGMFSNNDQLADRLTKAGTETGELVWRMPLAPEYDKMIDSKFADMKNTGGSRWGGAITAAQFIKRFVDDKTPWAHLDIAGTGFDSRQTDINKSWGSGWGVRLLDRLVADHYEK
jgi:leucyl aminopeptidase